MTHDLPPVPTGIQKLLYLASVDEAFRRELAHRPVDLASAAGVELTSSERAVLAAMPPYRIQEMAAQIPPAPPRTLDVLRRTAATAVVLLGGAAIGGGLAGCDTGPEVIPIPADAFQAEQTEQTEPEPTRPAPPEEPTPGPLAEALTNADPESADGGAPAESLDGVLGTHGLGSGRPLETLTTRGGGAAPDVPPPRTMVFAEATRLDGTAADADIVATEKRHSAQLRYCYQKEYSKNNDLAGVIEATVTIEPDGTVSDYTLDRETVNNEVVCNCFRQRVLRWKLPEHPEQRIVKFTWTASPNP